ncbi:MAG: hypothetical protein JY451_09995 [Erythrobacter sp.]|nr:MAG: hypothetical protein JY451_09995 [Erythrobacter sp.]
MSEKDDNEIVSESYRRRMRLMDRIMAPFDALSLIEFLFYFIAATGIVTLVIVSI